MKALFTILVSLICINSFAQVTEPQARIVAANLFAKYGGIPTGQKLVQATPDRYVYDFDNGWIMVRTTDKIKPFLGGNFTSGHFVIPDPTDSSLAINGFFYREAEKMKAASYLKTAHTVQWQLYSSPRLKAVKASTTTVGPLCSAMWNQEPYFNALTPTVSGQPTATGCVATAMAIIMKYWNYPLKGTGSYSYCDCTANGYTNQIGTLSDTFSNHVYSWTSMPNTISSANLPVAQLMLDCGISVAMDYGTDDQGGSGAYVLGAGCPEAQCAYVNNFGYNPSTIQGLLQSSYTNTGWLQILMKEINAGRPVQYEGFDPSAGGHTWPCDGYEIANGDTLLHFNFGWGGADNGYYSVGAINVAGYQFNSDDGALIGIQPNGNTPPPSACPAVTLYAATSVTQTSATLSWLGSDSSYVLIVNGQTINTTATSYNLTGLSAGVNYPYSVTGVCKGGGLSSTATNSFTTIAPPCTAPTLLPVANITSTSATLNWTWGQANVKGYVYCYPSSASSYSAIATVTAPTYTVTGLTPNTGYNWYVTGICANGAGENEPEGYFPTLPGSTPPPAPCSLSVLNLGEKGVIDTITCSTFSNDSIYYGTYKIGNAAPVSFSSTSFKLIINAGYSTTVSITLNKICKGGTTSTVTGSYTTPAAPPPPCNAPTGLAASTIVTITFSWTAVSGATGYSLQYKLNGATQWTTVTATTNTYSTTVPTSSTYIWQVASNCNGILSTYVAGNNIVTK